MGGNRGTVSLDVSFGDVWGFGEWCRGLERGFDAVKGSMRGSGRDLTAENGAFDGVGISKVGRFWRLGF
jgi:hypothetical protein